MIQKLWETTNISTIMLLKLFDDLCKECASSVDDTYDFRVPIHYIAFDYGLLDCYLDDFSLVLLFSHSSAVSDQLKTKSEYLTFIDRIVDSKHYVKMKNWDNNILGVWLRIPARYREDIEKVKDSKYSKVSAAFKEAMFMDYTAINGRIKTPNFDYPIPRYIVTDNIPAKIVHRSDKLKKALAIALKLDNVDTLNGSEFYPTWKNERELWDESKVSQYI